jgi:15-cis-phytoene synthase
MTLSVMQVPDNLISLEEAYSICRSITKRASSTFYLGSMLMPKSSRKHVWAIYSFCRFSDDVVDNRLDFDEAEKTLEILHSILVSASDRESSFDDGILNTIYGHVFCTELTSIYLTLKDTFKHSESLKIEPFIGLLDGMRSDLAFVQPTTCNDLDLYCNRVAGGVGEMILLLLSKDDPELVCKARKMGNSMQITNILRDIGEDMNVGRVYIPKEVLVDFEVVITKVKELFINNQSELVEEGYFRMMKELIKRNRASYSDARDALYKLPINIRIPLLTANLMYEDILTRIERNNYDVFNMRAFTSPLRKFELLSRAVVKSFLPMLQ